MPIDITMPRLSDTMQSGTVIKWNVKEGDEVSSGQPIADIETDKATMEMQVYDDGVVSKILVKEGEKVDVGTVIAVLAGEGESVAAGSERSAGAGASGREKSQAGSSSSPSSATAVAEPKPTAAPRETRVAPAANGHAPQGDARLAVSPVARRIADEHGVDVRSIEGSGPNGRVIKRDVLQAIERGAAAPVASRATPATSRMETGDAAFEPGDRPLSNMRQVIAKRLVDSKTTIPHYQVTFAFNMDPLLDLRATLNAQLERQGVKLSVNDFLVRACALAIRQHPEFNAVWGGDKITVKPDVNVGVAVSLPREKGGGLVVAVVRDADRKGLRLISEETRTLAEKARTRGLTIDEMSDSTFTISNLGMYGVEHFTAIINPPNAAILAAGAAVEKPVARNGQIVVGHEMQATLSLDHRIIDGAMAAQYMQSLKQLIENPATLLV
jgi:pyruvate dehydrogenase E2 component (dihydrolipoamide acetyltransferase)